ncbi:hypothetical protein ACLOJK_040761 [Asimina triloba]
MNLLLLPFLVVFVCFSPIARSLAHESNPFPRPLIVQYAERLLEDGGDVWVRCTSWRFAVEANNLRPWKTIPPECAAYVEDYMLNKGYGVDLETAASEAVDYARSVQLVGDGKDVWVFDVDETLLSNLPYYANHGFGLEVFDPHQFDEWVEMASAPVILSSLKVYKEVVELGFKVFLLTGRSEGHRSVTVENLKNAGFENWDELILRLSAISLRFEDSRDSTLRTHCTNELHRGCKLNKGDHGKPAIIYKSEKRTEMLQAGYRILGNSGDQWSDLLGSAMSNRSFKLPNPMYYIS